MDSKTKRKPPDYLLFFLTLALGAFGILMVFSASSMVSTYDNGGNSLVFAKKQIIAFAMGIVGMFIFMNMSYAKLRKLVFPLFCCIIIMLILVLMIGNGDQYGSRSWIDLGPLNLQPSEFAKLGIVLYLAALITNKGDKLSNFKNGLLPCLVVTGVVAFLILLEGDMGSASILLGGSAIVILVGGARIFHTVVIGASGLFVGALYIFMPMLKDPTKTSYRIERLTAMRNPFGDMQNSTWQIANSLFAFGHGGLTGTGIGNSIQKLHFLSQAHSDFIFAIIGEELGFIKTAIFLLVYALFIWRGIVVSLRCSDKFASLAGIGIMSMIGVQALINIGGVTNTIPMTGVTLPLISYGGSSALAVLLSMGIVLGISREPVLEESSSKRKTERGRHPVTRSY
ncbi:putative lipid II flippase FtsW [Gorillibacterium massiliense]|uniref:putative lipid II flippase FtsW n=1 Tax=Gorillibacterium massiliense TaxID=1280390 RepID=UPI0004AF2560|nr:putative lipid II flippase FtsW [Gorillibacterium massiliense]